MIDLYVFNSRKISHSITPDIYGMVDLRKTNIDITNIDVDTITPKKMSDIFPTKFVNAFDWTKIPFFEFGFHWNFF